MRVHFPRVDWGETDARNVLACVLDMTSDDFSQLGTRGSVLKQLHARSRFQLCHEQFLKLEGIPTKEVVACAQAIGNDQGFVRCSCTKK